MLVCKLVCKCASFTRLQVFFAIFSRMQMMVSFC